MAMIMTRTATPTPIPAIAPLESPAVSGCVDDDPPLPLVVLLEFAVLPAVGLPVGELVAVFVEEDVEVTAVSHKIGLAAGREKVPF